MPALHAPTLTDGVVVVRALRETDVPAIVAACQDPEIPRWTRVPSPYTVEDARRFLAISATDAAAGDGLALAVAEAGDDRLIGTIAVFNLRGTQGELGYWTAAPARGRGITHRAIALLRDWAHAELGLDTLEILAHRDNVPSQRVAERAGFTDTGALRTARQMPPGRREGYKLYAWHAPG